MTTAELTQSITGVDWYHSIDLPGNVTTPGRWDTRAIAGRLPIPQSLAGKRCLDIGTWDGFWAFEMERRGASEVVAIDLRDMRSWDWPPNAPPHTIANWDAPVDEFAGFGIAHEALGSKVQRRELSVYDLDPEDIGTFDFVFMGSLLPHLSDPVRALGAVRRVTDDLFVSADVMSLSLTLLRPFAPAADLQADRVPAWWTPNIECRKRWLVSAAFDVVQVGRPYLNKRGPGAPSPGRSFRSQFMERLGLPHLAIVARPASV